MKGLSVVALSAMLLCGSVLTYAGAASGKTSGLVDIDLNNVPVKQAIDAIFDGRGMHYIIEPGVTGKVVELKLKGISVAEALKSLGEAVGFTYTIKDDVYMIGPKTTIASAATGQAAKTDPGAVSVSEVSDPPADGAATTTMTSMGVGGPSTAGGAPSVSTNSGSHGSNARPSGVFFFSAPLGSFATGVGSNNNGFNGRNPGNGNGFGGNVGNGWNQGNGGNGWNSGNGGNGWNPNYGGYGNYYQPPPYVQGWWPNPPPPPGWVTMDWDRLLQFQWVMTRRPSFITAYPYAY
jgi:hypothetical protein